MPLIETSGLRELTRRQQYVFQEQKPSKWNTLFSDAIMNDITYKLPWFLKPAARKCVIASLDPDVVWANG